MPLVYGSVQCLFYTAISHRHWYLTTHRERAREGERGGSFMISSPRRSFRGIQKMWCSVGPTMVENFAVTSVTWKNSGGKTQPTELCFIKKWPITRKSSTYACEISKKSKLTHNHYRLISFYLLVSLTLIMELGKNGNQILNHDTAWW